ncbi:putative ABC transport system permease protein [Nitrosospira multiformis]|uniref:Putative ABC transport system permease protein n=1 Tax=Nitrosospira multiformis TaxID=1231 RepID=A0A2T5ICX2_9PROT|nr:FtsX-like permease family protein [Nitrosospira multiformis]PTQ81664.1 putative ABC transport system permease protein [Nitrosospira multiformis]
MNILKLSLRMLGRDWRAGELRVLVFALVVAVGGMTTVGFFADRVQVALSRQGNQLLGADLIIFSDHPLAPHYAEEAKRRNLSISSAVKFPSMTAKGEESLLTEIKAVAEDYPLRGELRISEDFGNGAPPAERVTHIANRIPSPGTVWVDEKLMIGLSLKRGDRIEVGASRFAVDALITQEPDYSIGFLNLRPRVLINEVDLPATGLIQQGSRIGYRLLVSGDSGNVEEFRKWAEQRLMLGEKIEGIRDARPEIRSALERAEKFLSLTALASVVLAAAAAALAVRRFTQRHLDGCAVMRCLGASQGAMLRLYLYHFLILGFVASSLGCLLGFVAQQVLTHWLSGLVEAELPWPTVWPGVHGVLTGMVLLLGFALPPLLSLRSVSALRVMRRDIGLPPQGLAGYGLGLGVLALLFLWKAGDMRLGASVIGGFIVAIAVFGVLGFLLMRMLAHIRNQAGGAWRYGLASIRRRAAASVLQAVALGLGLMALLALTLIRDDLLRNWRTSLPPDAPNHFLVNIQEDQLEPLAVFFKEHGIQPPRVFPMVRGRLTEINGKTIASEDYADIRAKRLVEREFNLSWASEMQSDNQIVKGRWWKPEDRGEEEISLEEDIAKTIGIHVGDTLTYDIAGSVFSAKVTSLRKVNWDSFRVNFFVVTPPGVLEQYPASYVTSFYLPSMHVELTNQLVKEFPNLLVLDVAAILTQVQKMIEQVTKAVEFVFLFTLLAGLAVLYAAIVSTQDERIQEAAIFRTLGARRKQLARAWAAEFAILGGLAGFFAAAGASALGYVVAEYALNLTYTFNSWIWLIGIGAGAAGVTLAGLLGTRAALSTPPLMTLRRI